MVVAAETLRSFLLVVNISSKMRARRSRTRRKHRVPKVCATREVRQTRRSIRPARGLRSEQRGRPGRLSHLRTKLNRHFILQPRIRNRSRRVLARVSKPKTTRTRRRTRRRQRTRRRTTGKFSRHPTASRSSRPLRFAQDFARRRALV